jgi:hypothetical protein
VVGTLLVQSAVVLLPLDFLFKIDLVSLEFFFHQLTLLFELVSKDLALILLFSESLKTHSFQHNVFMSVQYASLHTFGA